MRKQIILTIDTNSNPINYENHEFIYKYIDEYIDNVTSLEKVIEKIKSCIKSISNHKCIGYNKTINDSDLECIDYDTFAALIDSKAKIIEYRFNYKCNKSLVKIYIVDIDIIDNVFIHNQDIRIIGDKNYKIMKVELL